MKGKYCKRILTIIFLGTVLCLYYFYNNTCFSFFEEETPIELKNGVLLYNNIASVRASTRLKYGQTVQTKGYYQVNDGGSGLYIIRKRTNADKDNGGTLIFLNSGNVAELIADEKADEKVKVNVKQFGAVGDNITDDTIMIQNAINFVSDRNGGMVFFPVGQYKVTDTLTVSKSDVKICGADKTSAVLRPSQDMIINAEKLNVKWTLLVTNKNKVIKTKPDAKIEKGTDRIVVNDSSGIKAGMLAYIRGTFATSPWTSNNRRKAVKGETNKVLTVHDNVVFFTKPISDSFEQTEDVTILFVQPLEGIVIKGLGVSCPDNCPEDERQYRGFAVLGCNQALITDCFGNGCGSSCFESLKSYNTVISNNFVKNAWAYIPGSTLIYGLGYGLRATGDSFTEIKNNEALECRHCVDISGGYPSHNVLVANNVFKSSVSRAGVMSTHGPAEGCIFKNNCAEGPVSILNRGENISIDNNILKGKVYNYFGRNNIYSNNKIFGTMSFRQEDTVEENNYNIIKDNLFFIKSKGLINLIDGKKTPFTVAKGWAIERNNVYLLNENSDDDVYLFNIKRTKSEMIDLSKGFIFENNKVHHYNSNNIFPLKICEDMSRINM